MTWNIKNKRIQKKRQNFDEVQNNKGNIYIFKHIHK